MVLCWVFIHRHYLQIVYDYTAVARDFAQLLFDRKLHDTRLEFTGQRYILLVCKDLDEGHSVRPWHKFFLGVVTHRLTVTATVLITASGLSFCGGGVLFLGRLLFLKLG